jgi:peptidoglycan/xylan/chitin deacetylase (PgdA/CDA1 family)
MKKKVLALFLVIFLPAAFYFFWLSPRYTVPILMYHSINYGEGSHFVSPENFARQMEYIKKNGYEVITLDELVRGIKSKQKTKKNKVVITFDDGYQDNFKYAYPVLKKLGFPATIFIITDFMGKLPKKDKEKFLTWEEVIEMSRNNISFGSHTKSHLYLGATLDEKTVLEEMAGSKMIIEQKTGIPAGYFCYPSGGFNEAVKEMVKQAGYKGACTTNRGFANFNSDIYELKRVKVTNSDMNKPFSFWVKLSGYYNILRKKQHPHK